MREQPEGGAPLIRALGLTDVALMTVVAVVSLRWIARGARAGAPSLILWLLACGAFFVPLAAALMELSSRDPSQGGIYTWTRKAFGPTHGFICGWYVWVNNLFYFPSLLLFAASNALAIGGARYDALNESASYAILFVLLGIWLTVIISIVGLRTGKWIQNFGTIGVWVPAGMLIGAGAVALAKFGSATSFTGAALVPRTTTGIDTLALWSAMCFAFSGLEVTSFIGQEIKNPRRAIPIGVLAAGAMIAVIYIAGSAAVLVAVPPGALDERSGIADAVNLVGTRVGMPAAGPLVGGMLALGAFAGTLSWMGGSARVPFAAGVDRVLPEWLGRLHPKYRTPHLALLTQGVLASVILLASVFVTVTGTRSSIQDAYDVMVNLTILAYFVPYVYLFLALPKLRRAAAATEPDGVLHIPGGRVGVWTVTAVGCGATLVSIALLFIPPPGTTSVLNFEVNLIVQSAAVLGAGLLLYRRSR